MKIGYARVSTEDQSADGQVDALTAAGCEKIFVEKKSADKHRPVFEEMLRYVRPGEDALVVIKIDRLARSVNHLLTISVDLAERGVELISITEQIDTTTPHGKAFFTIMGVFAELERNTLIERTYVGLRAARKRGRIGGRPKKLSRAQIEQAVALRDKHTQTEIAKSFGVHVSTVSRALAVYDKEKKAEDG